MKRPPARFTHPIHLGTQAAIPRVNLDYSTMTNHSSLSRRKFLSVSTKTSALGLLASGLPTGWLGAQTASDAPETANINFGIIALTDCSPIVIAHEKGLFKKYGINSTVTKGASWAAIRDSLANGDIHATHMLIGMPIASSMGLGGAPKVPMIAPWMLNRNGQAISSCKKPQRQSRRRSEGTQTSRGCRQGLRQPR